MSQQRNLFSFFNGGSSSESETPAKQESKPSTPKKRLLIPSSSEDASPVTDASVQKKAKSLPHKPVVSLVDDIEDYDDDDSNSVSFE